MNPTDKPITAAYVVLMLHEVARPIFKLNPDALTVPVGDAIRKTSLNTLNVQPKAKSGQMRKQEYDALFVVGRIIQWCSVG
jgi:hypothetical protein